MEINLKEIRDKYPESEKLFWKWLYKNRTGYEAKDEDILYIKRDVKDICYCDLEKFFDDNGIIIEIRLISGFWYGFIENQNKQNYISKIDNIKTNQIDCTRSYNSRQEAKRQAILKAFEILNNQLEVKQ